MNRFIDVKLKVSPLTIKIFDEDFYILKCVHRLCTVFTNFSGMQTMYRTHLMQRHARRRRLQVQYENHIIRLRCLYKVEYISDVPVQGVPLTGIKL